MGDTTISTMAFSMTTLSVMTLSVTIKNTTLSIMTLSTLWQIKRRNKLECLSLAKLFQSNIMFVSKTKAYLSCTLRRASCFAQKYYTKLERLVRYKHFHLEICSVDDRVEKFHGVENCSQCLSLKHFSMSQKKRQNKLECLPLTELFQSNIIFVGKGRAYPNEVASWFLIQKYYTKLERLDRDKETTLLVSSVSDKERKVLWYWNL